MLRNPGSELFSSRIRSQKDSRIKEFKYFKQKKTVPSNPGSGDKKIPGSRTKEFKYINLKKCFPALEIWSRMFVPDPDLDFWTIPDPGVKEEPDSRSATLATGKANCCQLARAPQLKQGVMDPKWVVCTMSSQKHGFENRIYQVNKATSLKIISWQLYFLSWSVTIRKRFSPIITIQ